jgi:hypothetical protein
MLLCVIQGSMRDVVYEIEQPAWGSIGALTEVDMIHAHRHARAMLSSGLCQPGQYRVALFDDQSDQPLDVADASLQAPAVQPEAA